MYFPGRLSNPVPQVRIPGPANTDATTIEEFWNLLINKEIIDIIVRHTNVKIEDTCARMMAQDLQMQTYHHLTDDIEIRSLIGILYFGGWWKQSSVSCKQLWEKSLGISAYRCLMPRLRFMFLTACLRFDDKESRDPEDRFSPIREIWDIFIQNCTTYYKPNNNVTVDEQLLGFRGRCKFRMYIKSKPDKYGLKIISLNDANTSYMINAIPYLGKTSTPPGVPVSEYFLEEVTKPIHDTNRTVTCDNWFSSIPVFQRMLSDHKLTCTGTIRKNKRQIPQEMKVITKETPAKYCFSDDLTLLSFNPSKQKIVLVMSSYLDSTEVIEGKPALIQHYNRTKGGTDNFDKLVHDHTVSRKTLRWPMRIFFGMLDQAIVNSRILFTCRRKNNGNNETVSASYCLKTVYLHLVKPQLEKRLTNFRLRNDIRSGIKSILDIPELPIGDISRPEFNKRVRCGLCPRNDDHKTKFQCPGCLRAMCDIHRAYLCIDCNKTDNDD